MNITTSTNFPKMFLLLFLAFVLATCDSFNENFRKQVMYSYGDLSECIKGQFIVTGRMYQDFTQKEKMILEHCTVVEPLCAVIRQKLISPVLKARKTALVFGCFPSSLANYCDDYNNDHRVVICARNASEQMVKITHNEFQETYRRVQIDFNRSSSGADIVGKQDKSKPIRIHSYEKIDNEEIPLEFFGLGIRVSYGVISPQLAFYIIFICIAVLVKVTWLITTTVKTFRHGYVQIKNVTTTTDEEMKTPSSVN